MARTWRRATKDERATYGNRKQRGEGGKGPRDDFAKVRGNPRTVTRHFDPRDFDDGEDYGDYSTYR